MEAGKILDSWFGVIVAGKILDSYSDESTRELNHERKTVQLTHTKPL
jgi:hypothetical protein